MTKYKIFFGSATVIIWGIAHMYPTKSIIRGYGDISDDNINSLRME
jgi:hypothetical protein